MLRTGTDLLGDHEVPDNAWYDIHTLRAIENFPISEVTVNSVPELIHGMVLMKKATVLADRELGALPSWVIRTVLQACDEVLSKGRYMDQFPIDVFQGGAGMSVNIDTNEVLVSLALKHLGLSKGRYDIVDPNDHVNHGQSTSNTFPTSFQVVLGHVFGELSHTVEDFSDSFYDRGEEFEHVLKLGHTQLQDAVPMTLEQEFTAFTVNLEEELRRLDYAWLLLLEINLGATAIGTGLNVPPGYQELAVKHLCGITGRPFITVTDLIETTSGTGTYVMTHTACGRLATKLSKICSSLRLLSSRSCTGLSEINLPAMQAGSSIVPAKVNPVIPEVINQIIYRARGNDFTVRLGAEAGQLQLNAMGPVTAQALFESIRPLKSGCDVLRARCIDSITANKDVCEHYVRKSISVVTLLNDYIGHRAGDEVGREATRSGKSVCDVVLERGLLDRIMMDRLLSFKNLSHSEEQKTAGKS